MGDETRVGLGGDPVADRGFVAPGGRSRPRDNVQSPPGSGRIPPEAHSQHPTRTRMSRNQLHGERPEQSPSATTVTDTSHDPKHERITPVEVAAARGHPQDTHMQQVARCIHVHIAGGADGLGSGHAGQELAGVSDRAEVSNLEAVLRRCWGLDGSSRHTAHRPGAAQRVR
jgi:hypothetical protein